MRVHRVSSFDSLLDTIKRRIFRIAMLIIMLLWLGDKVRDTATAVHLTTAVSPCQTVISPDASRPMSPVEGRR